MRVSRIVFPNLLVLLSAVSLAAQTTPPVPSENQEPTLPPVVVRPDATVETPYESAGGGYFGSGAGGNIGWSSGAIRSDTTRVGSYNQPAWTTQRAFATTRTYVLPEGTYEFEQWVRPTWNRDGSTEYRMLEEVSLGLGCRWQLDLYERWNIEPDDDDNHDVNHEGVQVETRYALADWGCIPLNPTLYAEWVERGGPQEKPNKFELKLLLSDELSSRLFYSTNLYWEQEVSGRLETEYGWSTALGTPIIDRKLLGGVEMLLSSTTEKGGRSDQENSLLIGPSLHIMPTNRTFWDVVGLFGATEDSPRAQMYIVWGYQFGSRAGPSGGNGNISGPTSTRGN